MVTVNYVLKRIIEEYVQYNPTFIKYLEKKDAYPNITAVEG